MLALRRDPLDLEAGTAISLAEDNKGKRNERVKLHAVVVEHLKGLESFSPMEPEPPRAVRGACPHPGGRRDQPRLRYISMARQMDAAVASLHVPDVLRSTRSRAEGDKSIEDRNDGHASHPLWNG
jgi:hypothetical protein